MNLKKLFRKSYEYLIFVPMDKLWNLSYKGLRKLCCPSILITHDYSLSKEIIKDILNVCCLNCTNPHRVDCKHRKIVLKAKDFLKE